LAVNDSPIAETHAATTATALARINSGKAAGAGIAARTRRREDSRGIGATREEAAAVSNLANDAVAVGLAFHVLRDGAIRRIAVRKREISVGCWDERR
jgi:hypothetical protein